MAAPETRYTRLWRQGILYTAGMELFPGTTRPGNGTTDENPARRSRNRGEEEKPRMDTDRKGGRSADIPVRHLHPDGSAVEAGRAASPGEEARPGGQPQKTRMGPIGARRNHRRQFLAERAKTCMIVVWIAGWSHRPDAVEGPDRPGRRTADPSVSICVPPWLSSLETSSGSPPPQQSILAVTLSPFCFRTQ